MSCSLAARSVSCAVILAAFLMDGAPAAAAGPVGEERDLDCVIEPFVTAKIAGPVVGVIDSLQVDRGDRVAKGQIVARLEDKVERANVALARARATGDAPLKSAQARLDFLLRKSGRAEQLIGKNIVSVATLEEVQADAKVAQQQVAEASLNLQIAQLDLQRAEALLEQRVIRSPVDGVVVERLLSAGEYRNEQSPILTVAQTDPLRVEVFAPTALFGRIRPGMSAVVIPEEPVGGSHRARATVVDRVLDAASGTFGVRLELPNPDGALPGGLKCKLRFQPAEAQSPEPTPAPASEPGRERVADAAAKD